MGNALCGIVPTDMVCQREDQNFIENEKNLICLKHYNSQIIDKKLNEKNGIAMVQQRNRENEDGTYRNFPLSMPAQFTLVNHDTNPPYSLNEQKILVN